MAYTPSTELLRSGAQQLKDEIAVMYDKMTDPETMEAETQKEIVRKTEAELVREVQEDAGIID